MSFKLAALSAASVGLLWSAVGLSTAGSVCYKCGPGEFSQYVRFGSVARSTYPNNNVRAMSGCSSVLSFSCAVSAASYVGNVSGKGYPKLVVNGGGGINGRYQFDPSANTLVEGNCLVADDEGRPMTASYFII